MRTFAKILDIITAVLWTVLMSSLAFACSTVWGAIGVIAATLLTVVICLAIRKVPIISLFIPVIVFMNIFINLYLSTKC